MKPEDITIKPFDNDSTIAEIKARNKPLGYAVQDDSDLLWRLSDITTGHGLLDAWVLRAIADRLDEMNREHNEELDAAYKALPDDEEDPLT